MSTVLCSTKIQSVPDDEHVSRYRWPSPTTDGPSRPVLHIVASPQSVRFPEYMVATPGTHTRPEEHPAYSPRPAPEVILKVVRDQGRRHTDSAMPPSHHLPSASSSTSPPPPAAMHTRAKSTAGPSTGSAVTRRARAYSSATVGRETRPRPRLPSMLASVLAPRKTAALTHTSTHDPDLVGSFAPTSSPRPRLQSLLSGLGAGGPSSASAPSSPRVSTSTSASTTRTGERRVRVRHQSELPSHRPHWGGPRSSARSPPRASSASEYSPPPHSPGLPSICRTPSSESSSDHSGSEYFATTAPSSAGPATPVHTAGGLPAPGRRASKAELHPVLESLEHMSVFRVQTACATCGKHGSNFPTCPKCGEMWCSRPCRLKKGDGKRHVCASNLKSVRG